MFGSKAPPAAPSSSDASASSAAAAGGGAPVLDALEFLWFGGAIATGSGSGAAGGGAVDVKAVERAVTTTTTKDATACCRPVATSSTVLGASSNSTGSSSAAIDKTPALKPVGFLVGARESAAAAPRASATVKKAASPSNTTTTDGADEKKKDKENPAGEGETKEGGDAKTDGADDAKKDETKPPATPAKAAPAFGMAKKAVAPAAAAAAKAAQPSNAPRQPPAVSAAERVSVLTAVARDADAAAALRRKWTPADTVALCSHVRRDLRRGSVTAAGLAADAAAAIVSAGIPVAGAKGDVEAAVLDLCATALQISSAPSVVLNCSGLAAACLCSDMDAFGKRIVAQDLTGVTNYGPCVAVQAAWAALRSTVDPESTSQAADDDREVQALRVVAALVDSGALASSMQAVAATAVALPNFALKQNVQAGGRHPATATLAAAMHFVNSSTRALWSRCADTTLHASTVMLATLALVALPAADAAAKQQQQKHGDGDDAAIAVAQSPAIPAVDLTDDSQGVLALLACLADRGASALATTVVAVVPGVPWPDRLPHLAHYVGLMAEAAAAAARDGEDARLLHSIGRATPAPTPRHAPDGTPGPTATGGAGSYATPRRPTTSAAGGGTASIYGSALAAAASPAMAQSWLETPRGRTTAPAAHSMSVVQSAVKSMQHAIASGASADAGSEILRLLSGLAVDNESALAFGTVANAFATHVGFVCSTSSDVTGAELHNHVRAFNQLHAAIHTTLANTAPSVSLEPAAGLAAIALVEALTLVADIEHDDAAAGASRHVLAAAAVTHGPLWVSACPANGLIAALLAAGDVATVVHNVAALATNVTAGPAAARGGIIASCVAAVRAHHHNQGLQGSWAVGAFPDSRQRVALAMRVWSHVLVLFAGGTSSDFALLAARCGSELVDSVPLETWRSIEAALEDELNGHQEDDAATADGDNDDASSFSAALSAAQSVVADTFTVVQHAAQAPEEVLIEASATLQLLCEKAPELVTDVLHSRPSATLRSQLERVADGAAAAPHPGPALACLSVLVDTASLVLPPLAVGAIATIASDDTNNTAKRPTAAAGAASTAVGFNRSWTMESRARAMLALVPAFARTGPSAAPVQAFDSFSGLLEKQLGAKGGPSRDPAALAASALGVAAHLSAAVGIAQVSDDAAVVKRHIASALKSVDGIVKILEAPSPSTASSSSPSSSSEAVCIAMSDLLRRAADDEPAPRSAMRPVLGMRATHPSACPRSGLATSLLTSVTSVVSGTAALVGIIGGNASRRSAAAAAGSVGGDPNPHVLLRSGATLLRVLQEPSNAERQELRKQAAISARHLVGIAVRIFNAGIRGGTAAVSIPVVRDALLQLAAALGDLAPLFGNGSNNSNAGGGDGAAADGSGSLEEGMAASKTAADFVRSAISRGRLLLLDLDAARHTLGDDAFFVQCIAALRDLGELAQEEQLGGDSAGDDEFADLDDTAAAAAQPQSVAMAAGALRCRLLTALLLSCEMFYSTDDAFVAFVAQCVETTAVLDARFTARAVHLNGARPGAAGSGDGSRGGSHHFSASATLGRTVSFDDHIALHHSIADDDAADSSAHPVSSQDMLHSSGLTSFAILHSTSAKLATLRVFDRWTDVASAALSAAVTSMAEAIDTAASAADGGEPAGHLRAGRAKQLSAVVSGLVMRGLVDFTSPTWQAAVRRLMSFDDPGTATATRIVAHTGRLSQRTWHRCWLITLRLLRTVLCAAASGEVDPDLRDDLIRAVANRFVGCSRVHAVLRAPITGPRDVDASSAAAAAAAAADGGASNHHHHGGPSTITPWAVVEGDLVALIASMLTVSTPIANFTAHRQAFRDSAVYGFRDVQQRRLDSLRFALRSCKIAEDEALEEDGVAGKLPTSDGPSPGRGRGSTSSGDGSAAGSPGGGRGGGSGGKKDVAATMTPRTGPKTPKVRATPAGGPSSAAAGSAPSVVTTSASSGAAARDVDMVSDDGTPLHHLLLTVRRNMAMILSCVVADGPVMINPSSVASSSSSLLGSKDRLRLESTTASGKAVEQDAPPLLAPLEVVDFVRSCLRVLTRQRSSSEGHGGDDAAGMTPRSIPADGSPRKSLAGLGAQSHHGSVLGGTIADSTLGSDVVGTVGESVEMAVTLFCVDAERHGVLTSVSSAPVAAIVDAAHQLAVILDRTRGEAGEYTRFVDSALALLRSYSGQSASGGVSSP